jgi:hypothetical protein
MIEDRTVVRLCGILWQKHEQGDNFFESTLLVLKLSFLIIKLVEGLAQLRLETLFPLIGGLCASGGCFSA